jgi:ATP-binding cassette, subfamily B, bacterial
MHTIIKIARQVGYSFAMVWSANPRLCSLQIILHIVTSVIPVGLLWSINLVIDNIQKATVPNYGFLIILVTITITLTIGSFIINQIKGYYQYILRQQTEFDINQKICRKALELDLSYFEDADFYNKLKRAQGESSWRTASILYELFEAFENFVTVIGLLGLLFFLDPLVTIFMIMLASPLLITQNYFARRSYQLNRKQTADKREMGYLATLLTNDASAKEIKLFNLGGYLLSSYAQLHRVFLHQIITLKRRELVGNLLTTTLGLIGYVGAFVFVVLQAANRQISIGELTAYSAALLGVQRQLFSLVRNFSELYQDSLYLDDLRDFLTTKSLINHPTSLSTNAEITLPLQSGYSLKNISFSYPNSNKIILKNINLEIRPGEIIALVGENGAGKTTLVKLLCRLYDPTDGIISLNGTNLPDYKPESLYNNIGVIFQDFVRYMLSTKENIGFGDVDKIEDIDRIKLAAFKAGADEVVADLPKGFEHRLGTLFEDSSQLSGGQWQRISLARAYMRDSAILILDEPTASLDACIEYETFQRFRELTAGKISILISHRFSNVRMADRIVVLENGEIVEQGTHDELLNLERHYAKLFNMQASGYQ